MADLMKEYNCDKASVISMLCQRAGGKGVGSLFIDCSSAPFTHKITDGRSCGKDKKGSCKQMERH